MNSDENVQCRGLRRHPGRGKEAAVTDLFGILAEVLLAHRLELFFVLLFYVYGSIPFAFIFTYLVKGEKIYEKRTKNVGVANSFSVGGLKAGFPTVAGEASKALLPLFVSHYFFNGEFATFLIFALSTSVGTSFSLFLKGKGGLGSTILIVTLLIFSPLSALIAAVIWGIMFKITRDSYRSSLTQHFSLPAVMFIITNSIPFALFGLLKFAIFITKFRRSRDEVAYLSFKKNRKMLTGKKLATPFSKKRYVTKLGDVKRASQIGIEACNLRFLIKNGFRVPKSYVCNFTAYEEYLKGNENILKDLEREIELFVDENAAYSVIPSPNISDGLDSSIAGQLKRYSNIKGVRGILDSINEMWQSAREETVTTSLDKVGKSQQILKISVIVQETIIPKLSGVVFTKNPMNGRDEIIVEAVSDIREAVVQEEKALRRWVYKWGEWIEKPKDSECDFEIVRLVVKQSKKIEERFRRPSYLQWTYNGKDVYWLDLKEVTSSKGVAFYSNKIPKEFFPGIIKPLVWSVNVPMVCGAWIRLFSEIIGGNGLESSRLAKSFYYRAYFNMGVIGELFELFGMPREALELLIGFEVAGKEKPKFKPSAKALRYLPRMVSFAIDKIMFSNKIERFLADKRKEYDLLGSLNIKELDNQQILRYIDILYKANEEAAYFNVVTQLLNSAYNTLLKRQLEKKGLSIEEIDFSKEAEKYRDIDVNHHLSVLHKKYSDIPQDKRLKLADTTYESFSEIPYISGFKESFEEFLGKFGHLSDKSSDFSCTSWRENPELILKMITKYAPVGTEHGGDGDINELFEGTFKGFLTKIFYKRAVKYREYKERVSSLFTYGHSLFRGYILQIGELFKRKGFIDERDDIFYLELDEIKDISDSGRIPIEHVYNYRKRKKEISECKDIELPDVIYGDAPPKPVAKEKVSKRLKGIAASKGYFRGRVTVVKGLQDFDKMKHGGILVIPHSDASWTPLFAKAKAVISESGGILSHSAIVAREYNIPAVVSVRDACKLRENSLVTVDGYNGEVTVMN
jgi:pyruvate,water dikinase